MGKVLLEKLLYSCSDVKEIIVLVRPKRGKNEQQRVAELLEIPVRKFLINFINILNSNNFRCLVEF